MFLALFDHIGSDLRIQIEIEDGSAATCNFESCMPNQNFKTIVFASLSFKKIEPFIFNSFNFILLTV
jgi:hypothetical protein